MMGVKLDKPPIPIIIPHVITNYSQSLSHSSAASGKSLNKRFQFYHISLVEQRAIFTFYDDRQMVRLI